MEIRTPDPARSEFTSLMVRSDHCAVHSLLRVRELKPEPPASPEDHCLLLVTLVFQTLWGISVH